MVSIRRLGLAALVSTAIACSGLSGSQDAGPCTTCDAGKPTECAAPEAGTVSLTHLSVTSSADSSLKLVPAYSPGIHDYYVQCAAGANELDVSLQAPSGVTTSMSIESPGGSLQGVTGTSLNVDEGQAIVVTATAGKTSVEYWVRCVPHDFPAMQWTTRNSGCTRPPGYYLIGTMSLPINKGPYAIVLDQNGVPVWYRSNATGGGVYDVETLVPGAISFAPPWQVDHLGGTTTFPIVYPYSGGGPPGTPDPHELRILQNLDYLALQSPGVGGVNLTGLTLPLPGGGSFTHGPKERILACEIQQFDSTHKVSWQWTATDHFDPAQVMVIDDTGFGDLGAEGCGGDPPGSPSCYVEPFHCNSIDVDPNNGNLLVSARHMNSVFYIDKATRKVLWKMGGANSSKDGAVFVPVDDPFIGQHDARFLPGWKATCSGYSGQISLFDDQSYTTNPARGTVYDVQVDLGGGGCSDGGTSGASKATLAWHFDNPRRVPSNVTGSFRITADGSRIVGWGQSQPSGAAPWILFTEVDEKGNDLLDLICPDGSSSYRAVKVPLSAFDLGVLRSTAGTEG